MIPTFRRRCGAVLLGAVIVLIGGCDAPEQPRRPEDVRAEIVRLLPTRTGDREGWARDIYAAFSALQISPSTQSVCSTLAIAEQESGFSADPVVPGLGKIALAEIDRRAEQHKLPRFLIHGALLLNSPNGKPWHERLAAVRTEQDLSRIYEEFIASVPMGKRLLQEANPVHTAGPMQVSISFAEQFAGSHPYPYPIEVNDSIRHQVFTRRGGVYFGIAHLLGYPTSYPEPLYRFADYNAGFYASRNAAFQQAVSRASGIPIKLDGDLVRYGAGTGSNKLGATEVAVLALSGPLELSPAQIHRALEKGEMAQFEDTKLYKRVFDYAEQLEHRALPRAILPRITLTSPKITRKLTTEWFATRVNQRYQRCMARAAR